jgi:hypothetical protein
MAVRFAHVALGMVLLSGLLVPSSGRAQSDESVGVYQSLDRQELAQTLSAMNMTELLEALVAQAPEGAGGLESQRILAQAKTARATSPSTGQPERARLLDEAADQWEKIVAQSTKTAQTDEQIVRSYRDELMLAYTRGQTRCEPHAVKLMYLSGGPADRKVLLENTEGPVARLSGLSMKIEDRLMDWRPDFTRLVTVVPELENLQTTVRYAAAWVNLYRALGMSPDDNRRQQHLLDAITLADKFVRGEPGSWRDWSILLTGIAQRAMGEYGSAETVLSRLLEDPKTVKPVQYQALFEQARLVADQAAELVRSGKKRIDLNQRGPGEELVTRGKRRWESFDEARERFAEEASDMVAGAGKLLVQIREVILANYAYDNWAESLAGLDDAAARQYAARAQEVLIEFLETHDEPAVRNFLYGVIADRYGDRTDYDDLNSVVLLAIALKRINAEQEGGGAAGDGVELLEKILQRDDEVSEKVKPLALWNLGATMVRRRENLQAAKYFLQLARNHPEHDRAMDAAHKACLVYMLLIEDRQQRGQQISVTLRREFVDALQVMLGRDAWAQAKPQWHFDLGWQSERISRYADTAERQNELLAQAAEAYAALPADQPQYMQARNRELEIRARLLRVRAEGGADVQTQAGRLAGDLADYAEQALRAAGQTGQAGRKEDLQGWAANAQFQRAVVLYELLDRKDQGLQAALQVATDWPDSPLARDSREFVIRKYIEQGKVDAAIAEVETFRRQYPQQAAPLLQQIIARIREAIKELQRDPTAQAELASYREVYLRFARDLLQRAEQTGGNGDTLYQLKQLYADALLQSGEARQALNIFQDLEKTQDQRRRQRIEQIEAHLEKIRKQMAAAGDSASRWLLAVEAYRDLKRSLGLDQVNFGSEVPLADAVEQLRQAGEAAEQTRAISAVRIRLDAALEDLRETAVRSVAVDAGNLLGLGRAHAAVGNGDQALEYYRRLVSGLSPAGNEWLYWQAQLEYAQTALESLKASPEQMEQLAARIRVLRSRHEQMGGLLSEFAAIQSQAEERAK